MIATDTPTLHALSGYCSYCRRVMNWNGLRAVVSPMNRQMILCGRCDARMGHPQDAVCCTGEAG